MQLFIDIYGFFSVLLRGSIGTAQSLAVGGVGFLLLVAVPVVRSLGSAAKPIAERTRRLVFWSSLAALGLVALDAVSLAAMLVGALELSPLEALTADAVRADALALPPAALLAFAMRDPSPALRRPLVLAPLALALLAARLGGAHAVSRLDSPPWLAAADLLHLTGVALWIGGIPYLLTAMCLAPGDAARRDIGRRFSHVSMAAVAMVAGGGIVMAKVYVGSLEALLGLSYGVMVAAKIVMFAGLLGLGALNFLAVRSRDSDAFRPQARLRRFAEVEIGIGFTIVFAAASLSSLPPAVDLPNERASWREVAERLTPRWPIRLESPDHAQLSISQPPAVYTPGAGIAAPRNFEDIAWSEYNHHIAGLFVAAMGLLALLEHVASLSRIARHWPLLMLGLAGFLFLRADEAVWPLGELGLLESLRDPEIAQHRIFLVLIVAFAVFEWRVRTGRIESAWAPLAFPLVTGAGGALLLTHSHGLANIKEEFLIEITHTPLALVGLLAASARWLEIRLDSDAGRIAGRLWPVAFMLAGLMLVVYREA
jgi:putative copper resistance protein D